MTEEFRTVLVDPPWEMYRGGNVSMSAQKNYPTQTQEEIIATVMAWLKTYPIAPEAHLYLWSMNAFPKVKSKGVIDALSLCDIMGFKPMQFLPWIKNEGNPTPYGIRCTELCLFAERHRPGYLYDVAYGRETSVSVCRRGLTTSKDYIISSRTIHSAKPAGFYDYIEERSQGPYLELYARNTRDGWTSLGNEAHKGPHSIRTHKQRQKQLQLF